MIDQDAKGHTDFRDIFVAQDTVLIVEISNVSITILNGRVEIKVLHRSRSKTLSKLPTLQNHPSIKEQRLQGVLGKFSQQKRSSSRTEGNSIRLLF